MSKTIPIPVVAAASAAAALALDFIAGAVSAVKGGVSVGITDIGGACAAALERGQLLSAEPMALACALAAAACIWAAWAWSLMRQGNFRYGEEHGSAKWATVKEMARYSDTKDPDNNVILSANGRLRFMNPKHEPIETNNNIVVIGGPGTGKTRYVVTPNMLQMNANFFLTDPKGTTIFDLGWVFEEEGYDILTFDTIHPELSNHFNPLDPRYVHDEQTILKFVNCLIKNTTGDKQHSGDPFWENAEKLLYMALVGYLVYHIQESDRNIGSMMRLLALADAKEEDESYMSALDFLFNELETGKRLVKDPPPPDCFRGRRAAEGPTESGTKWVDVGKPVDPASDFALGCYKQFKVAAGKTLKSIIISCNVRMKPFDIPQIRELMAYDELHLDEMGAPDRKIVVFASMSDTDSTFNFLFALLMQEAMDTLCQVALDRYHGSLPRPVHFMFDEFANIGTISDFERIITVTRSRNIAITMILQSLSQLKENYGDNNSATILNACDTLVFLGGKDDDTNERISKMIGKETVSTLTHGETRGQGRSGSSNYNLVERDLMQASEVARMPRDEMLVLINGGQPFKDKKYDQAAHPRYKQLEAGKAKGAFEIDKYRERHPMPLPAEPGEGEGAEGQEPEGAQEPEAQGEKGEGQGSE